MQEGAHWGTIKHTQGKRKRVNYIKEGNLPFQLQTGDVLTDILLEFSLSPFEILFGKHFLTLINEICCTGSGNIQIGAILWPRIENNFSFWRRTKMAYLLFTGFFF